MSDLRLDVVFKAVVASMNPVDGWIIEWCGFVDPPNRFVMYGHLRATRGTLPAEMEFQFATCPWSENPTEDFVQFEPGFNHRLFREDAAFREREFTSCYNKFKAQLTAAEVTEGET